MKTGERILIKLIIIQFIFLMISQLLLHKIYAFPELLNITQYEGVMTNPFQEIVETMNHIR